MVVSVLRWLELALTEAAPEGVDDIQKPHSRSPETPPESRLPLTRRDDYRPPERRFASARVQGKARLPRAALKALFLLVLALRGAAAEWQQVMTESCPRY